MVVLLGLAYVTLLTAPARAWHETAALVVVVALGLTCVGALFEAHVAAWSLESSRLVALTVGCVTALVLGEHSLLAAVGLACCVGSLAWLLRLRAHVLPLPGHR